MYGRFEPGVGWDLVNETADGTVDIWWIFEGQDYPRLWSETTETEFEWIVLSFRSAFAACYYRSRGSWKSWSWSVARTSVGLWTMRIVRHLPPR